MTEENKVIQHDMFDITQRVDDITDNSHVDSVPDDEPAWPTHERFPYNRSKKDGGVKKAGEWIVKDLETNPNILIITGFTSLSRIISFLSKCFQRGDMKESIRIMIGNEPRREEIREVLVGSDAVDAEIRGYLLGQQLSIYQCFDIMQALKMLSFDYTQVRRSRNISQYVHAKIYKTDTTITFGSSNFSQQGLEKLTEVNLRLSRQTKAMKNSQEK